MSTIPQVRTAQELMTRRTDCRACRGKRLRLFLDLGEVPLANSFLTAKQLSQAELRFPLEVYFCEECCLIQLVHVVNPEVLFSHYLYRTGTNQTIAAHNRALAEAVVNDRKPGPSDLVVEVASNDGSLLQCFKERGVRTLGVEPAKNIAQIAREGGIETLNEFFDDAIAQRILNEYGPASAVIGNNVLAHVDATIEFLGNCKKILPSDGRVIIEVPYLGEMLDRLEYDTIYHEHLCYFSVTALMRLFAEAGMALDRVDHVPIHGGSLRLWGKHSSNSGHSASVREMAEKEKTAGLTSFALYEQFAGRVKRQREELRALLTRLKKDGKSVAGYGAPAKGNTLLCYCGIGTDLIPYTVDMSPLKVGLLTPGSHIPVAPVQRIFDERPEYVVILAWNFAPEIMKFLQPLQQKGTRFILPIPEPKIL
jgi:hypothetical protein